MTGPEQGFLLLTSSLGDRDRKPLTVAQFRNLAKRVQEADREVSSRDLCPQDLVKLGYDISAAEHIYGLLSGTNRLREYLRRSEACDCYPITRLNPLYPGSVRSRLRMDSPGVLWAKGDITLLNRPAVAVIGSRDLDKDNRYFAEQAGYQIAMQGYVLVSGNARGADKTAQNACLEAGGQVISVVADSLQKQPLMRNVLWLSLDDFDQEFSAQRALRRNHIIHTLAELTIAAQCTLGKGGTWDGICANLKYAWNPVCIFADGTDGAIELENRGVQAITVNDLKDLSLLSRQNHNFIQE